MRRAQSLRNHTIAHNTTRTHSPVTDDLGILKELAEDSTEDTLRKQLLAKDRENDKLQAQILTLQDQLAQRPPIEHIQELQREYKNLEILLQGTQRENERCMAELERVKGREKIMERELMRLIGEDWQSSLSVPSNSAVSRTFGRHGHGHSSSISLSLTPSDASAFFPNGPDNTVTFDTTADVTVSSVASEPARAPPPASASTPAPTAEAAAATVATLQAALAQIAQMRSLILGMDERSDAREARLAAAIERAEDEARRFEAIRQEVDARAAAV